MSAAAPPNPDDPIEAYVEHLENTGLGKNTVYAYENAMDNHLRPFLDDRDLEAGDLTREDCTELITRMMNKSDLAPFTVEKYAGVFRQFYGHYNARGTFEVNPMKLAMEEYDFGDKPESYRREISVPEMAEFMRQLSHPLHLAIIMILVKTGIRAGELCNLDLRDIHLDDARFRPMFPSLRPEIEDRPDSIYVERHAEMQRGMVVNGEERIASNKRKRSTIIPIDDELKRVLRLWLAIRPESKDPGRPLINRLRPDCGTELGDRLNERNLHRAVTNATEDYGWWDSSNSKAMNVSPHYFRHFFTTHMRDRTNDTVFVQFIRGDIGDDAIDDYTHNWGDKVRTQYSKHIYKFYR